MAEVIPQINIDGTKIKNTWTEKEYVTDEVYNALNKAVIDLKNNNNLLDSTSILFREEYNSSSKNLNNAIHQGVYSFTSSAVNAPSGVNGGNLLVTNTSKTNQGSSIITQIAFCHNGAIYIRTKNTTENFTNWILVSGNNGGIKSIEGSNDTLTITKGNNSTQDITINNVSNADNSKTSTKATQDSQGQTINTTYIKGVTASNATLTITKGNGTTNTTTVNNVSHATNADNSTKATQDKNGNDITTSYIARANGYFRGTKDLNTLYTEGSWAYDNSYANSPNGGWGKILVLNNYTMTNDSGSYIYQLAFPTTGNTNFYFRRNITNTGWTSWREVTFTDSPAFSGTPTAPTPSTSDNSTKIATTAFVKSLFTASKATNGWHKEASTGFIWQWGQEANYHDIMDGNYGSSGSLNFPISFPNKCLAVMPYLIGSKTFCCVSVSSFTNATITVHWNEWASTEQSVKFGYIAVGY